MRVAHITHVKDGLAGGIERHIFNLASTQKARGDSPVIVSPGAGSFTAACNEYGIPTAVKTRLAAHQTLSDLSTDTAREMIDDLCSLFTDFGVEVIHGHVPRLTMIAIAAGNKAGIPCVYTHHMQRAFEVLNPEFAAIAVNRSTFKQLKDDGFPEERLFYVPHGTKVLPRVTSESPRPGLIWVGRLEHIKGPDLAILAFAEVKRRQNVECPVFNIYGEGSLEQHLKAMVSALRLDDAVQFHGAQPGILERCPATDILVVSSREEAGPLVALEAMSRGMPIVATRVGEIEDMIPDKQYGYTVQTGSIPALADGIESMLSDVQAARFDPELPISRHRALYTVEKMAERVEAIYKCLITSNAPAR